MSGVVALGSPPGDKISHSYISGKFGSCSAIKWCEDSAAKSYAGVISRTLGLASCCQSSESVSINYKDIEKLTWSVWVVPSWTNHCIQCSWVLLMHNSTPNKSCSTVLGKYTLHQIVSSCFPCAIWFLSYLNFFPTSAFSQACNFLACFDTSFLDKRCAWESLQWFIIDLQIKCICWWTTMTNSPLFKVN